MSDPAAQPGVTIERFLGRQAASGGPFALLGLPVQEADDAEVVAALQAQLERVDESPLRETPEADEVRLALHAAAAQLMDPSVRGHMLARWRRSPRRDREVSGSPSGPGPAPMSEGGASVAPSKPARSSSSEERSGPAAGTSQPAPVEPPNGAGAPGSPPISREQLIVLEHDAILTLAKHGGWNRRSLRDIAMLAHARGIGSDKVAAALSRLMHHRELAGVPSSPSAGEHGASSEDRRAPSGEGSNAESHPSSPGVARAFEEDPGGLWAALVVLMIFTIGALVTSVAIFMPDLWRSAIGLEARETQAADVAPGDLNGASDQAPDLASRDAEQREKSQDPDAGPSAPAQRAVEPSAEELLERAGDLIRSEPARSSRLFATAVKRIAEHWTTLEPDELVSHNTAIIEYLYRAGVNPDVARRGAEALARLGEMASPDAGSGGGDAVAAVWAGGTLVRLSGEQDLVFAVESVVDEALAGMGFDQIRGGERTFGAGLRGALSRAIEPLTRPTEARTATENDEPWARWARGVRRAEQITGASLEDLRLSALAALATAAPEPSEREWVHAAMTRLVGEVGWDESQSARAWLVRMFESPRVSRADLAVLTGALVRLGTLPGLDPSMAIGADATDADRVVMRDRYAGLWGIESSPDVDAFPLEWRAAVERVVRSDAGDRESIDHLAGAASLALLNEAAAMRWLGDASGAMARLEAATENVEAALGGAEAGSEAVLDSTVGDEWATRYLELGNNLAGRLAMLDKLSTMRTRDLGPMAAEVLVTEAMRGNRSRVRARAHELVRGMLTEPNIVLGALELLPRAPPTRRNLDLIETIAGTSLPAHDDPRWMLLARRGIVERGLEVVAAETDLAAIDRLATVLAEAYRARSRLRGVPDATDTAGSPDAGRAARALRAALMRSMDREFDHPTLGFSPGDVEDRRASRAALARGPVAGFLAEQLAVAELLALAAAWERPDTAERVGAILDDLASRRRTVGHVFAQLEAAEHAIARLWSLRMEALE